MKAKGVQEHWETFREHSACTRAVHPPKKAQQEAKWLNSEILKDAKKPNMKVMEKGTGFQSRIQKYHSGMQRCRGKD